MDGKAVVTASLDGVVAVWNPRTGSRVWESNLGPRDGL